MRVPQARRQAVCRAVAVKVKPLRGGLAADLDSAAAARVPTRREATALSHHTEFDNFAATA
jgi:hypothetical protein